MGILHEIDMIDFMALAWFAVCWFGYGWYADRTSGKRKGLVNVVHGYRLQWMATMLQRENRIMDSSLIGNLVSSVSFFASTTIYIIAGILALMGTTDRVISVASTLSFFRPETKSMWELKLLLLLAIFVYAYFKFTWSLRQFNLLSILIGGAPLPGASEEEQQSYVRKAGLINSFAGDDFNRGVRAYYFALAALTWLIQPLMFLLVTTAVVIVLYRRDYRSRTLAVVSGA
jgi:uncharacterized membrane protein